MHLCKFIFISLLSLVIGFSSNSLLYAKGSRTRTISRGVCVQSKKIEPFSELVMTGSMNVYLTQGTETSLQIEGSEADIKLIEVVQKGDNLMIKTKNKSGFTFITKKVDVYITTPSLSEVNLKGSVHLSTDNQLHLDKAKILSSGSSKVTMSVNAKDLEVDVKGSGHITLNGYAQHQTINVYGSATYKSNKLLSGSADVNLYGSGTAYLDVERELNVKVYGSGNVLYKGNPLIQSQSFGSGKVKAI
ncbi:MAG: hypothetical protein S4CHLAM6_13090 [Chlamydiae bacterium]|nr:hypothetical protein [Chlamydiota bacterium]